MSLYFEKVLKLKKLADFLNDGNGKKDPPFVT
jgi:hypothetical protein